MENKCILSIKDFYFSEFQFKNKRILSSTKLDFVFSIKTEKEEDCYTKFLTVQVLTENGGMKLKLVAVGKFIIDESEDDKKKDYILKYNTIAYMLPFVRSQISLLTTQPGITPFMMPPINVEEMIDSLEHNKN